MRYLPAPDNASALGMRVMLPQRMAAEYLASSNTRQMLAAQQGWLPAPGSSSSSSSNPPPAPPSDWLNSIAGPTALIMSPRNNQTVVITGQQTVTFDGSASQPLRGTTLISYDWVVTGTTADSIPYETSFLGPVKSVALPAGHYSVTLTVQAVRLVSSGAASAADMTSVGTDFVGSFAVRNLTADAGSSRPSQAAAGSSSSVSSADGIADSRHLQSSVTADAGSASQAWQQPKNQLPQQQHLQFAEWNPESGLVMPAPAENFGNAVTATSPQQALHQPAAASSSSSTSGNDNGPFSWAFDPVIQQWDGMYGPGSAYYEHLKLQQQAKQQQQLELERIKQLLNPPPPPPFVYVAPAQPAAPPATAPAPIPVPVPAPAQAPSTTAKGTTRIVDT